MKKIAANNEFLRALPSVDALLKTDAARNLLGELGSAKLTSLARRVTADLRQELITDSARQTSENGLKTQ